MGPSQSGTVCGILVLSKFVGISTFSLMNGWQFFCRLDVLSWHPFVAKCVSSGKVLKFSRLLFLNIFGK